MSGIWITGPSRSGKTQALISWFAQWCQQQTDDPPPQQLQLAFPPQPGILVLSATSDNRIPLQTGLSQVSQARFPFKSTTPLGFFEDEVKLFWALLVEALNLPAQFPLRLRPETEQAFATKLWRSEIASAVGEDHRRSARLVRRILDLMQLAALSETPSTEIARRLQQAFGANATVSADPDHPPAIDSPNLALPIAADRVSALIEQWRTWCQARGLLSYSLIAELYGQHLLPHPVYQQHLHQRYQVLIADDVDEYPALARSLLAQFLVVGPDSPAAPNCILSFNPNGAVRLGLGADPQHLATLSQACMVRSLEPPTDALVTSLEAPVLELINDPINLAHLPETIQTLQATTRAQLIRQTAETIVAAVRSGQVEPQDVAIIGPGLDPISRYALREILTRQGIAVELVNDQRPLASSPPIRALLTLMALVYPGLGRQVNRDLVAEMLVTLSRAQIDPVRAGLIADHCFVPDVQTPTLLSAQVFPRWDRLGWQVSQQYAEILQWLEIHKTPDLTRLLSPNPLLPPVELLDRAIQRFCLTGSPSFEQLAALRELIETASHYWTIAARLDHCDGGESASHFTAAIASFIQLLRHGTITANPFPVQPMGAARNAVTLATVFQYRSSRRCHRWQFWFDAGTTRWLSGVDALFGAPWFLQDYAGQAWTIEDQLRLDQQRLNRILPDLFSRTTAQVFLCYSDLATNGQEQTGILSALVSAASPYVSDPTIAPIEPDRVQTA